MRTRIAAFLMVVVLVVIGMVAPAWADDGYAEPTIQEALLAGYMELMAKYPNNSWRSHVIYYSASTVKHNFIVLMSTATTIQNGTAVDIFDVSMTKEGRVIGVVQRSTNYPCDVTLYKNTQWSIKVKEEVSYLGEYLLLDFSIRNPTPWTGNTMQVGVTAKTPTAVYQYDLGLLLGEARQLEEINYISGWQDFMEALQTAESCYTASSLTYTAYHAAKQKLQSAMDNLIISIPNGILENLVAEAESKNQEQYTASSWGVMQTVLRQAKSLLTATEAEIEEIIPRLRNAIDSLEPLPDSGDLRVLLAQAQTIRNSYTAPTWNALQAAIKGAIRLLDSREYSAQDLSAAADQLQIAIDGLTEMPPGSLAPSTLEPMIDSLLGALAVIVPVGICILAILLVVSLWPRILKRFTRG